MKGQYATSGEVGNEASTCQKCEAGTFNDEMATTGCKDCPFHTYNEEIGSESSSACIPCPKDSIGRNQTTREQGSPSVEACFAAVESDGVCRSDPAERRVDDVCTLCPRGFYGTGDGTGCVS